MPTPPPPLPAQRLERERAERFVHYGIRIPRPVLDLLRARAAAAGHSVAVEARRAIYAGLGIAAADD